MVLKFIRKIIDGYNEFEFNISNENSTFLKG